MTDCPPSQVTTIFVISAAFPCKKDYWNWAPHKGIKRKGLQDLHLSTLQLPTTCWMNSPLTACGLGEGLEYLGLGKKKFQLYGFGETFIPVACWGKNHPHTCKKLTYALHGSPSKHYLFPRVNFVKLCLGFWGRKRCFLHLFVERSFSKSLVCWLGTE